MTKPRFNLTLTLRDNHDFERPLSWAINADTALRISARAVDNLKMSCDIDAAMIGQDEAIEMMRVKEMRRDIFKRLAVQLAEQMADRMEDAEGWHDPGRIEPARRALGGEWKN